MMSLLSGAAFQRATGYTALFLMTWSPLLWGYGYKVLKSAAGPAQEGILPIPSHTHAQTTLFICSFKTGLQVPTPVLLVSLLAQQVPSTCAVVRLERMGPSKLKLSVWHRIFGKQTVLGMTALWSQLKLTWCFRSLVTFLFSHHSLKMPDQSFKAIERQLDRWTTWKTLMFLGLRIQVWCRDRWATTFIWWVWHGNCSNGTESWSWKKGWAKRSSPARSTGSKAMVRKLKTTNWKGKVQSHLCKTYNRIAISCLNRLWSIFCQLCHTVSQDVDNVPLDLLTKHNNILAISSDLDASMTNAKGIRL